MNIHVVTWTIFKKTYQTICRYDLKTDSYMAGDAFDEIPRAWRVFNETMQRSEIFQSTQPFPHIFFFKVVVKHFFHGFWLTFFPPTVVDMFFSPTTVGTFCFSKIQSDVSSNC